MKRILLIILMIVNIFTTFSQIKKSESALLITNRVDGQVFQIKQDHRIAYWTNQEKSKHIAIIKAITDSAFMTVKDTVMLKDIYKIGERSVKKIVISGAGTFLIICGIGLIIEGNNMIEKFSTPIGFGVISGFSLNFGKAMRTVGICFIPTGTVLALLSIPRTFDLNTKYTIKASEI